MLKNLKEIIVQNFMTTIFFNFLFSGLIDVGLFYISFMTSYCVFRREKKSLCAYLCYKGEGANPFLLVLSFFLLHKFRLYYISLVASYNFI